MRIPFARRSAREHPVLPNFLIVGCPRCGTTSLYHYLMGHPDIFLSRIKEPAFLTAPLNERCGSGPGDRHTLERYVTSYDAYCDLFARGAGKPVVGEGTIHTYYYGEAAVSRIREFLGDPMLLFLLRNPVERAFSAYMLKRREDREPLTFEESLEAEPQRMRDGWHHSWFYTDKSFYARKVDLFRSRFSKVHVCLFDHLSSNPVGLIRQVCRFLGVDDSFTPATDTIHNAGGVPRWKMVNDLFVKRTPVQRLIRACGSGLLGVDRWNALRERARRRTLCRMELKPDTRVSLKRRFRDDILELQSLTGLDLSGWL